MTRRFIKTLSSSGGEIKEKKDQKHTEREVKEDKVSISSTPLLSLYRCGTPTSSGLSLLILQPALTEKKMKDVVAHKRSACRGIRSERISC